MPSTITLPTGHTVPVVDAARDLIATAAALGLDIPAPAGTTVHQIQLHPYHHGANHDGYYTATIHTLGTPTSIHTTEAGALHVLADWAVRIHDTERLVRRTPWACPGFFENVSSDEWRADMPGWVRRHRAAQDVARDIWVAEHSPLEIVEELLGARGKHWDITLVTINP